MVQIYLKLDALIDITQEPTAPETKNVLGLNDIKSITFDNDKKQGMTGSELWQQSNWKEILFDGKTSGDMAEFKWYFPEKDIAEEVKLPTDMNFTFNKAEPLKTIKVYNREKSNGHVTSIKATAYAGDTAYDLGTIDKGQDVFEFTVPAEATNIDRVVITPLTSTGTATGTQTGSETNRMLSLREIEFETDSAVKATGIEFTKDSADSVYTGAIAEVSAVVTPNNATNPFYEITSSDENIAKVIKIPMEDKYIYAVQGIKEGTVTLTATSKDGQFTATKEFTVTQGVDSSVLQGEIDKFEDLYENLYTVESYAKVEELVNEAKELIASDDATQDAVDKITIDIVNAMKELEFKGSNTDQPSSQNLIPQNTLKRYDESSMSAYEKEDASYTIDGKTDTIWHSNYSSSYKLPQYVTIDLGAVYDLEQVNMLPRQNNRNGHITHYRIEVSTDGTTFTPVVEGYLPHDGNSLDNPGEEKEIKFDTTKAQYVRFIAIESLGDRNNAYASIAELNFYGTTESGEVETVNKAALEAAVTTANALKEQGALNNVIPAVVAEFNAALAEAEGILADSNADQATVDASFFRLATAIQMVDFVKGDKTELIKLVEEYSKLEENNYTTASWKVFKGALDAAIVVNEDENALEYEVQEALNNLKDGYAQLVVVADKTALQAMVDKVNGLDEKLYTEASWAKLADPMAKANEVLANKDATQDEVNAAYEALVRAYLELRLIPNKDLLEDLINKAQSFEAANYTADSYANLRSALLVAQSTLANESADEAAVKAAVEGLQASIDALVPVSADNNVASGDKTAIATGDSTSMLSSIAGLALASIAMFGAKRRKKSK